MRALVLIAVLLLACGESAPEVGGRDAAAWSEALEREETRAQARSDLERAGTEAVPVLAALVRTQTVQARGIAIELLTRLGPDAREALPALTQALGDPNPAVRGFAAIAVGRIAQRGSGKVLVALERLLADPVERVRVAAALAVWGISHDVETTFATLLAGLGSESPAVRAFAAEAFTEMGALAVDPLTVALADGDHRVRAIACDALALIGPEAETALPALEALADSPVERESTRAAAREAIARIRSG